MSERFPWTEADEREYRRNYWEAWTGDPKWVGQARRIAELRISQKQFMDAAATTFADVEAGVKRLAAVFRGEPQ